MRTLKQLPWKTLITGSAGILVACVLLAPQTYRSLGDIFFGRVPALYNVNLAQLFYTYAAYPPIGASAPFAHYQLSRTYFIQGLFDRSLDEVYKEIEEYPEHYRSFYILGLTLGFMDREEEAIEAF